MNIGKFMAGALWASFNEGGIMFRQLRDKELPNLERYIEEKPKYSDVKIELNDLRNSGPLVNLKDYKIAGKNHYNSSWNPPYYLSIPGSISELFARKSVAQKLTIVNERLEYIDLEVYVFDAYRPLAVQNYFYFHWFPEYLKKKFPEKNEEWIITEVRKYWAKGVNSLQQLEQRIPPHSTGGALDLTLSPSSQLLG